MEMGRLQRIKKDEETVKEIYADIEEKTKTLSYYENEAKRVYQKWVRLRDAHLPCISCGKTSNRYDGGHFFDAGIYSGLIFHPFNCNKQCSYNCNKMLHGNKLNYRIGLIKKIGDDNVKWLEENKDRLRNYKYSKEELIEIKKLYQDKIKRKDFNNEINQFNQTL